MGLVVNKSFIKVKKSICKKSEKLLNYLLNNNENLYGDWTVKQNKIYDKLSALCDDVIEEIANLDEIEVPDYEKTNNK